MPIKSQMKPTVKKTVSKLKKRYLIGGDIAPIGTVEWTDKVIDEADSYFRALEKEAKESNIKLGDFVAEDYIDHLYDTLVALGQPDNEETKLQAEQYYTEWLLVNEANERRAAKVGGIYKRGGIPNNYKGKSAEQVWSLWDERQKQGFILDHNLEDYFTISEDGKLDKDEIKYKNLHQLVKYEIESHVEGGQYKSGGGVDDYTKKLGMVEVIFENPEYNYSTNVSGETTEEDARDYFVGKSFNVASYPKEKMASVIDIKFHPKGTYASGGRVKNKKDNLKAVILIEKGEGWNREYVKSILSGMKGVVRLKNDYSPYTNHTGLEIVVKDREVARNVLKKLKSEAGIDYVDVKSFVKESEYRYENGGSTENSSEAGKQKVVDAVIEQIIKDVDFEDITIEEELFNMLSKNQLLQSLNEEKWAEYESSSKQEVLDAVLEQMKKNVKSGDVTVEEELLLMIPKKNLIQALPEQEWSKYETVGSMEAGGIGKDRHKYYVLGWKKHSMTYRSRKPDYENQKSMSYEEASKLQDQLEKRYKVVGIYAKKNNREVSVSLDGMKKGGLMETGGKAKNTKVESYLPIFPGFYNTLFQANEESVIEDPYKFDDYDFDYKKYEKHVGEKATEVVEEWLEDFDIKIKFQEISSPREYNFGNDSINVEYTLGKDSMKKIINYLKEHREEFEQSLKERYTSRSGFISSYSNDVDEWISDLKSGNDFSHRLGSVLEFILTNEGRDDEELYNDVSDSVYLEGELKQGIRDNQEYIENYAKKHYKDKSQDEIAEDIMKYFNENDIDYSEKTVRRIINEYFESIESTSGKLFSGGGSMATGGLSKYWTKAKDLGKSAYEKATPHVKKAYEATKEGATKAYGKTKSTVKQKIHDQKKKIALEVIEDTKDKVIDDKKAYTFIKNAEQIVEAEYKSGGKISPSEAFGLLRGSIVSWEELFLRDIIKSVKAEDNDRALKYLQLMQKGMIEVLDETKSRNIDYSTRFEHGGMTPDEIAGKDSYILTNGDILYFWEESFEDMAGETNFMWKFNVNAERSVTYNAIKHLLKPNDKNVLDRLIRETGESNEANSIDWVE